MLNSAEPTRGTGLQPARERAWPGRERLRARARAALGIAAAGLGLSGCTPALDWREVRLEGPRLVALFPCRPIAETRSVSLEGRPTELTLHACEADGRTFAVAVADVGDAAQVGPSLSALRRTSDAKLDVTADGGIPGLPDAPTTQETPWSAPAGATPQPAAARWRRIREGAGGGALAFDSAVFARGTWVVQASVIAPAAVGAEAAAPFFEGLQFAR